MTADELLHSATASGDLDGMRKAIANGANIDLHDGDVLYTAVDKQNPAAVALLLSEGADVNACRGACLRHAAEKQHVEIVEMLLDRGADPRLRRLRALEAAAYSGNTQILGLLLRASVPTLDATELEQLRWEARSGNAHQCLDALNAYGASLSVVTSTAAQDVNDDGGLRL